MRLTHCQSQMVKPFLCWAGGKTHLITFLRELVPSDVNCGTYWEPFLGAGSLFFSLRPARAVLSDSNAELIACFRAVRRRPDLVSRYLRIHATRASKHYYYALRTRYNKSKDSLSKAAMFIYLNKACFNGIWRVNTKGEFNVPYGYKEHPALPSRAHLMAASDRLKKARLRVGDFRDILKAAQPGDFIYLDPPYPPLNETAYFTHYTRERFGKDDQIALAEIASLLTKRGCKVLISNADTHFIRALYKKFHVLKRGVTRWIRTDGKRYKAKEIALFNYFGPI